MSKRHNILAGNRGHGVTQNRARECLCRVIANEKYTGVGRHPERGGC